MADIDAQLTAIRAELAEGFTSLNKRLDRIERTTTRTQQAVKNVEDAVSWQTLINDAILCGVCLVLAFGAKSADVVKQDLCPELPVWARHAVPFGFCGSGKAESNAAQAVTTTEDAKLKAFLDAIAWAEGTSGETGYSIQFTGSQFSDKSDHPRQIRCSGSLCSDAAGRYQFLSTTWDGYASRLGLKDFSPASQDRAAAEILKQNGIPEMLAAGRVEDAFCKIGNVWASMPCNNYGQPQKSTADLVAKYNEALQKYEAIAPTSNNEGWINPAPGATFTSGFGYRDHPISSFRSCHYGIDLAAPTGTPILAAKGGMVEEAGWNNGGFGNLVVIDHGNGVKTLYAHNSQLKVSKGQQVAQGDIIALMGSTGNSTGPHLHFEMDLGQGKVDPRPHIPGISGNQTFGKIDPQATQTECRGRAL